MSNRTNMAMADAWLTADVALARKKRKNELETKNDEYDALLETIRLAQIETMEAEDDAGLLGGILTAGAVIIDQWANISSGGLWPVAKGIGLAYTGYAAGSEAGRAIYQGGWFNELDEMQADIAEYASDIENYDWLLSAEANKYNRDENDDIVAGLEDMSSNKYKEYEDWSDEFYNWEDHAINASAGVLKMGTTGETLYGKNYADANGFKDLFNYVQSPL